MCSTLATQGDQGLHTAAYKIHLHSPSGHHLRPGQAHGACVDNQFPNYPDRGSQAPE